MTNKLKNNNSKLSSWLIGPVLFLISCVICEGILAALGYPGWRQPNALTGMPNYHTPDAELGWKNKSGAFNLTDGTTTIKFTVNPDASRVTANSQNVASKNTIIFLGDSFVQGYALNDNETFTWKLQEKFPNSKIINFGTGGYGTYQSLLSLKHYLNNPQSEKDVTFVYLFNVFHELRNVGDVAWLTILYSPPKDSGFHFPYCISAQDNKLECVKSPGILVGNIVQTLRTLALINETYNRLLSLPRLSKKREVTKLIFEKMKEASKQNKLLIAFFDIDDASKSEYQAFFKQEKIETVDCALPERYDSKFKLPDGHPNAALNEKIAACLSTAAIF